jgi:oxygen-independent coproporphyrinogen III oxidase
LAGIYIHIPFCKKACHYCNFHFSTNLGHIDEMVDAICKDIELRQGFLFERELDTIYFGGGTPSLLSEKHIIKIFNTIAHYFTISNEAEITLEANPDDISKASLSLWKANGINRLSIGIQSFFDEDLLFMNRAHNASEAIKCIELARSYEFNLSVDLIYGAPTTSHEMWKKNIEMALSLELPHISAYCLTIEDKTVFGQWLKKDKIKPIEEDHATAQFEMLIEALNQAGYDHYEISNFAFPNQYAVHNTNYWRGNHYLGVGPSAHSYDGRARSWAVAHNPNYIKQVQAADLSYLQEEELTLHQQYNEYMMTGLRTMWGVTLSDLKLKFGEELYQHTLTTMKDPWVAQNTTLSNDVIKLTQVGKNFADNIAAEFFVV